MKYCDKCGKQMDDEAMFCTSCGAKQEDEIRQNNIETHSKKGNGLIWLISILSVVVLMLIAGIVYITCFRIPKSNLLYTYNKDNKTATLVECKDKEDLESIKIPKTVKVGVTSYKVTAIGDDVFAYCKDLTEIVLPDSVVKIGSGAFKGCENLTDIELPDDLQKIGDKSFKGCTSLKSIEFPSGLKSIGDNAFEGCISLNSMVIPDSIKVGKGAFDGCWAAAETENPVSEEAGADVIATEAAEAKETVEETEPVKDYGTGELKVWVPDAVTSFTEEKIQEFQDANPEYAGYTVTVESVGEGDAASNMITDVEGGADIYCFTQDQLVRLVSAGALAQATGDNATFVTRQNDKSSVRASTIAGTVYAYPITSDNGYFLYYDKSVVTDPTSLDKIVADCEAAGKSFYFEINSGWYQTAFFFGNGCTLTYETDDMGNFTACNIDYASDKGVEALRAMIELHKSYAFENGSSFSTAINVGAIVDGIWDSDRAKELFGDNYACAKLPAFNADGKEVQLSGFVGFRFLGVKPQTDADKLAVCHAIAKYLSSEEVQLALYRKVGWGPSNMAAQQSTEVQDDEALSASLEQSEYSIPQGMYPNDYWWGATSLGDCIIDGEFDYATDDELMWVLEEFEEECKSACY